MASLDFSQKVQNNVENITHGNKEAMLGRALNEPFSSMNSGSRKLMYAKELEQVFPLINGEQAIVETGYEIRYGDRSSSIVKAPDDCFVLAKIPKYSFAPDHHYFMIVGYAHSKKLDVIEKVPYTYITESYGYLNNTGAMDGLRPGDYVPKDTLLKKSVAFDDYGNRKDGLNLKTIYMALDHNYEDSIIISEPAAKRYCSPLIHQLKMIVPNNFIPLNLHGGDQVYKVLPDIGERIPECVVAGFRPEVKDESYFAQQKTMLQKLLMSDEKYVVHGDNLSVMDIEIKPNDLDMLKDSPYYAQINMYYEEQLRFAREVEEAVSKYNIEGYELGYDLQKLYFNCKRLLRGDKYVDKGPYTGVIIYVTVLEERYLGIGDKLADRNGGKGVVSNIWPEWMMPCLDDGTRADVVINSPTMYGRENPAQCIEVSITHVSRELLRYIEDNNLPADRAIALIIKYINMVVPNQAEALKKMTDGLEERDLLYYLESVLKTNFIKISSKPITESFDIDRLNELYKAFPFIGQSDIYVPLMDSNGKYRLIKSRRKSVLGVRYTLRLKQFAEEKFSAVSMSSTNLRNENVKSKAATNYRTAHSSTCNRLGYQEAGCLSHMGTEYTVANLMIHSTSPHARRLTEQMETGDPHSVDIQMTEESKNRNAEFALTYLKAIGLRMNFVKKLIEKPYAVLRHAITFRGKPEDRGLKPAIQFIDEPGYDFWAHYKEREEAAKQQDQSKLKPAIRFKMKRNK